MGLGDWDGRHAERDTDPIRDSEMGSFRTAGTPGFRPRSALTWGRVDGMTDWVSWHRQYDDLESSLARRLVAVQHGIARALDGLAPGPIRILSLCAGDGRDLVPVVAGHARRRDVDAVLIEQDARLVAAANQRCTETGLAPQIAVRQGDAGDVAVSSDVIPVDLLMLCGIFGNISDADIATTVNATPQLVAPGGFVIWTRGSFEPDRREQIRAWFRECGCDEISYDAEPNGYGVGVVQRPMSTRTPSEPPTGRLFTFTR